MANGESQRMREVHGRQPGRRSWTMAWPLALVMLSVSLGLTSAQQSSPACGWLHNLLTRCQPAYRKGGGIVGFLDACPGGAPGHINYARVRIHSTGAAPWFHLVEGWWVIWSPSERRWYKLYDERFVAGPSGQTQEMYFCHLPCGASVRGYEWVVLSSPIDDPDFSHVSADVMETACFDCRTPTPTPEFPHPDPSTTPPTACMWHAFVPWARRE